MKRTVFGVSLLRGFLRIFPRLRINKMILCNNISRFVHFHLLYIKNWRKYRQIEISLRFDVFHYRVPSL